jgi:hypothetical protein
MITAHSSTRSARHAALRQAKSDALSTVSEFVTD